VAYEDPSCALCPSTVQACRQGEASGRGPGFCPSKVDPGAFEAAHALYDDDQTRKVALESARVEEVVRFSQRMGYKKPSTTVYVCHGKKRQRLRFTKTGDAKLEKVYATHFIWPGKGPFHPPAPKSPAELARLAEVELAYEPQ